MSRREYFHGISLYLRGEEAERLDRKIITTCPVISKLGKKLNSFIFFLLVFILYFLKIALLILRIIYPHAQWITKVFGVQAQKPEASK